MVGVLGHPPFYKKNSTKLLFSFEKKVDTRLLPADDIRDKPEYNKKSKFGLLDENFQLKPKYNKENLKEIFSEMIGFSLES